MKNKTKILRRTITINFKLHKNKSTKINGWIKQSYSQKHKVIKGAKLNYSRRLVKLEMS